MTNQIHDQLQIPQTCYPQSWPHLEQMITQKLSSAGGVLLVNTEVLSADEVFALLNEHEQNRFHAYVNAQKAQSFVKAHAIKRLVLARFLALQSTLFDESITAKQLQFTISKYGKPSIEQASFNISHSENWVAIIVRPVGQVGIDIELVKPRQRLGQLINRIAHPDELPINNEIEFYQLWCKKEAFTKTLGLGMHISFETLNIHNTDQFLYQDAQYSLNTHLLDNKVMLCYCQEL